MVKFQKRKRFNREVGFEQTISNYRVDALASLAIYDSTNMVNK